MLVNFRFVRAANIPSVCIWTVHGYSLLRDPVGYTNYQLVVTYLANSTEAVKARFATRPLSYSNQTPNHWRRSMCPHVASVTHGSFACRRVQISPLLTLQKYNSTTIIMMKNKINTSIFSDHHVGLSAFPHTILYRKSFSMTLNRRNMSPLCLKLIKILENLSFKRAKILLRLFHMRLKLFQICLGLYLKTFLDSYESLYNSLQDSSWS